jgi:hypothetical protein
MKSFISRKTKDFEKWDFFSFCVVLTFAVFCGALSISVGLSCADDAWQANIAQNIAMGKGYTFPWSYSFDESEPLAFPPWNSCGPAFILPLAFGIRLLPFSEATPGLCTVGLWLLLLLVSGILLRSFLSGRQVFTASVVFVATLLVSFGWHFEQWYASLGEVVAALYLVISIILLSRSEGRAPIFISGIIFSFALLSKVIMAFAAPCFLVLLVARCSQCTSHKEGIYCFLLEGSFFGLGALLPQIGYEMLKMFALGSNGYAENWKLYYDFLVSQGLANGKEDFFQMLQKRLASLHERYGLWQPGLILILGLGFAPMARGVFHRVALGLSTAILFLGAYWLFKSLGWPRYFSSALVLYCALAALLVATSSKRNLVGYFLLVALTFSSGAPKIIHAINRADNGLFQLSSERLERLATVKKIKKTMSNHGLRHLHSGCWAGVADLIYYFRGDVQFVKYDPTQVNKEEVSVIYASNKKFGAELATVHRKTMDGWHVFHDSSGFFACESLNQHPSGSSAQPESQTNKKYGEKPL